MLPWYEPWLSIDRIDSNWNYCKENCRWADIYTQNANRKWTYKEYNWMTLWMFLREKWYNENEISYAESLRSRKKCNLEFIIEMIPKRKIYKKKLDLI
jgi:hypothetical protein